MIHTNALGLSNDFSVQVLTTKDRGFTPEEIAERAADKIVSVSDNATPEVRAQAEAFRQKIVRLVTFYIHEGVKNDRTTVCNAIVDAGQPELAELIRRL